MGQLGAMKRVLPLNFYSKNFPSQEMFKIYNPVLILLEAQENS